jgi:hypothetical protein
MIVNNPISIQGEITRAVDLATLKQNDDNKAAFVQLDIQKERDGQETIRAKRVLDKDDLENDGERHDAKEKGKNEYMGDGGKNRRKQDGVFLRKGPDNTLVKGFDARI